MEYFDSVAATWDEAPHRKERALVTAEAILGLVPAAPGQDALEFGCGTGLLGFFLADPSSEMLQVVEAKAASAGVRNLVPVLGSLGDPGVAVPPVDLVFSLMVLHHVPDTEGVFRLFHDQLNPGGYLAVADLVTEDGSFHRHEPGFDGHNGFDPTRLADLASSLGFTEVSHREIYRMEKDIDGVTRTYPLFLLVARRD